MSERDQSPLIWPFTVRWQIRLPVVLAGMLGAMAITGIVFACMPQLAMWLSVPIALLCAVATHYIIRHTIRDTRLRAAWLSLCWLSFGALTAEFVLLQARAPSPENVLPYLFVSAFMIPIVHGMACAYFVGPEPPKARWCFGGAIAIACIALALTGGPDDYQHVVAGTVMAVQVIVFFGTGLGLVLPFGWKQFAARRLGKLYSFELGSCISQRGSSDCQRFWDMVMLLCIMDDAEELHCDPVEVSTDYQLAAKTVHANAGDYRLSEWIKGSVSDMCPPSAAWVTNPMWLMKLAGCAFGVRGKPRSGAFRIQIAGDSVDVKATFRRTRYGTATILQFPPHQAAQKAKEVIHGHITRSDRELSDYEKRIQAHWEEAGQAPIPRAPFHYDACRVAGAAALLTGVPAEAAAAEFDEIQIQREALSQPGFSNRMASVFGARPWCYDLLTVLERLTGAHWIQRHAVVAAAVPLERIRWPSQPSAGLMSCTLDSNWRWMIFRDGMVRDPEFAEPVSIDKYLGFSWQVFAVVTCTKTYASITGTPS